MGKEKSDDLELCYTEVLVGSVTAITSTVIIRYIYAGGTGPTVLLYDNHKS